MTPYVLMLGGVIVGVGLGWYVRVWAHVCEPRPVVVCEDCRKPKTVAEHICDWPGCKNAANRLRTHRGHFRCADHKSL